MVEQVVPTRFSAKIVKLRCGSTGIYGEALYCGACLVRGLRPTPLHECEDAGEADFDPSWRFEPTD